MLISKATIAIHSAREKLSKQRMGKGTALAICIVSGGKFLELSNELDLLIGIR
jgi:hypothetical protein